MTFNYETWSHDFVIASENADLRLLELAHMTLSQMERLFLKQLKKRRNFMFSNTGKYGKFMIMVWNCREEKV